MRAKSAIDLWFKLIFYGTVTILIGSAAFVPTEAFIGVLLLSLLVAAFLLWIYFRTYYELRDELLYCKSGPFVEKIPYDKIRSARLCRNLLSSMALSSKRIEIRQHGKGYILGTTMISPVNREEFLTELLKRCKNLD